VLDNAQGNYLETEDSLNIARFRDFFSLTTPIVIKSLAGQLEDAFRFQLLFDMLTSIVSFHSVCSYTLQVHLW